MAPVNRAASIEVALTGSHLFNAAYSKQSHYRNKHKGWDRIRQGLYHARWKFFDLLWGNGESVVRILFTGFFVQLLAALVFAYNENEYSFLEALVLIVKSFWGIDANGSISFYYSIALTFVRYSLFGLFMTVLIKRLSHR